jgi:single-stranded DNA-binding protein
MINGNTFIGKVSLEPELKTGKSGGQYLKVGLYLGGKKESAVYVNVTLFDAEAQEYKNLAKGDLVMAAGVPESKDRVGRDLGKRDAARATQPADIRDRRLQPERRQSGAGNRVPCDQRVQGHGGTRSGVSNERSLEVANV